MKRIGFLWDKVTSIENIKLAHKMARKDKAFYKEVQMVDANLDECAKEIQSLLVNKEYNKRTAESRRCYVLNRYLF